jgi:hypothetical protein
LAIIGKARAAPPAARAARSTLRREPLLAAGAAAGTAGETSEVTLAGVPSAGRAAGKIVGWIIGLPFDRYAAFERSTTLAASRGLQPMV